MARSVDPTLRTRLIDTATRLFAEQGYADVGMEAIGAAAGVTKGGVYFHFRSKEVLFFAVVDHWRGELRATMRAAEERELAGAAALERVASAWLHFHLDRPGPARVLRVLAAELRGRFTASLREDAREEQRALRARIRLALTRGGQDGTLYVGDPALVAFVLAGTLEGLIGQWLTSPQDAEPFCGADGLAEAVCAPYATGATGAGASDGDAGSDFRPPF